MTTRQIHLAAFLIAGPCAHSHALWRHPLGEPGFLDPDYYRRIAQSLERGRFDLAFFADRLAMSSTYGGSIETGARYGDQDSARLDPLLVTSLMAASTRHLGLAATRSTTYFPPFQVARAFASLDHLSGGRAGWNVVTSVNDSEARNHGIELHLGHDARYDSADEFMEVVFRLWESWDADALILDRENGIFADPDRIHPIAYRGAHLRCEGPLNVPRSPQGRPVIIQAGASARGKDFAARWAEVIFALQPTTAGMKKFYADVKSAVERAGRARDACQILAAVMPFVGASRAEAEEKLAVHDELVQPLVGLSTMSSHMNVDFSRFPLDEPLGNVDVQGMQGALAAVRSVDAEGTLPLSEIGKRYGQSVLVPRVVGTAADVADQLEAWFREDAADGFMVSPAYLPGGFDDFIDGVVPELQRRELFRREYAGRTLRENLFGVSLDCMQDMTRHQQQSAADPGRIG
ncbi:MAG: LLM class flavin-dependent oxidoreductase [Burkholderiales bacterium]|nr:LLM class flavin-dependent oxidoreductase [Burkholderiales bacterium]